MEEPSVILQRNSTLSKNREIFTLGTSQRNLEEFIKILKHYQIELIIDVRRWPKSKKFSHFNKENLIKALEAENISYLHLEELGGYRREGYEKYMSSERFSQALERVIKEAENKRVCLICAEKAYFRCHRRFIAQALKERGFWVKHIFEIGRVYEER